MAEAYTAVAPDSTGDKVRTNELTILQADGTRVTVSIQIVSISDAEGNIIGVKGTPMEIDSSKICGLLEELIDEVHKLRTE